MRRASTPTQLTVVLCVAEIVSMLGVVTFPSLLPGFLEEWKITNTDAGWINGIYYAGYLLSVPVLVSLTDRMAPRRIYYFSMALTGVVGLLFAFFAEGFWSAMLFRILAGIGLAGTYMPGLKLLSDHLKDLGHGRPIAFYTASFGIGTSISYLMAGEISAVLTWQWAFGLAAIGPVVSLLIIHLALPREDPELEAAPDTHLLDFRPVLRCRPAMGYVLAYTAHNFELFAMRSWIVAFLVFAQAQDPGGGPGLSATMLAMIVNLLGLPSSVIGNELSGRFGRHRVITVVMLSSALLAGFLGFAAYLPFWAVVVLMILYGVTVTADSASITAGVIKWAPEGYRGATMAVHSCIGFMGSFAGPLMFGVALDLSGAGETVTSWGTAFAFTGLVVATGPLALRLLRQPQV